MKELTAREASFFIRNGNKIVFSKEREVFMSRCFKVFSVFFIAGMIFVTGCGGDSKKQEGKSAELKIQGENGETKSIKIETSDDGASLEMPGVDIDVSTDEEGQK